MNYSRAKIAIAVSMTILFVSCKNNDDSNQFMVSGTITNSPAQYIYLEELPIATMQRTIVDSTKIGTDGKYSLHTRMKEASAYTIRLDQNEVPIAALINDTKKINMDAKFDKGNNQFPETYTVNGSPASQKLKDFMLKLNNNLQAIYFNERDADSLHQRGAADSVLKAMESETTKIAVDTRQFSLAAIADANNPAVAMYELGNYQSSANNPVFKLAPIDNEEVAKIVDDVVNKFPQHKGIATIKAMLAEASGQSQGMVGKEAPEISMPDVNGKTVTLSSFRGKYVLVDFWASWCGPCRQENPNVVKAWAQFKDKNFAILGVSLDREDGKQDWLNAIREDQLTWTEVSDLKFWNTDAVAAYGIDAIPNNVLVDPQGKIIAQGLHGAELQAKLAEVLK